MFLQLRLFSDLKMNRRVSGYFALKQISIQQPLSPVDAPHKIKAVDCCKKENWPLDLIKLLRNVAIHSEYMFKGKTKVLQ